MELQNARKEYEKKHQSEREKNKERVKSSSGASVEKVEAQQLPLNNSINGAGPTAQAFWGLGEFTPYHLEQPRAHDLMQFL